MVVGSWMQVTNKEEPEARRQDHCSSAARFTFREGLIITKQWSENIKFICTPLIYLFMLFQTDTASVLQEANVYIKILHEQIKVLTNFELLWLLLWLLLIFWSFDHHYLNFGAYLPQALTSPYFNKVINMNTNMR